LSGARAAPPRAPQLAPDLEIAGGVPLVLRRLQEAGLLHEDAGTVTGQTVGEIAAAAVEQEDQTSSARCLSRSVPPGPGHPARQPRARRLRGQARRLHPALADRTGARLRVRGGRHGGRAHARAYEPPVKPFAGVALQKYARLVSSAADGATTR
jgi:hypothetical protein